MGVIRFSDGVRLLATPATARLLWALDGVAQDLGIDLTVTSGAEPQGRLATDPHMTGEAVDVRTKDLPDDSVIAVYDRLVRRLDPSVWTVLFEGPTRHPNIYLARVQYLNPKATNYHFHIQRKKGQPTFGGMTRNA